MPAFAEGVPCWAECALPDPAAGRRFYGRLFGWTFRESPADGPGQVHIGDRAFVDRQPAAALVPPRAGLPPATWTVYFATPDARALADRVERAGGRTVTGPDQDADSTRVLATDPDGALFGLWQPGRHKGFRVVRSPGTYCWSEVHTRRPELVDPFYEHVFGYTGTEPPELRGFRLWSPKDAQTGPDTAVTGREVMDAALPSALPAHFLTYFRVEDCERALASAVRLGGGVRTEPETMPYGTFATVTDDQGALFGLLAE